ncbi:MAG: hypothetical protein L0Y58_11925 [Verrucomicrobia subdivision 3 bacterium]|nr:hypothetical protein [Limisphaerales bacterium]
MTSILDKLNLTPQERRLVVFVSLAVFVVLNIWLVWPEFGRVAFWEQKRKGAITTLNRFNAEVKRKSEYQAQLEKLQEQGGYIATDEQALALSKDVANQAALSGVVVNRYDPAPRATSGRTNAFFEEQGLVITVTTGEKELVDFLYNLGARGLIRVKSMSLSPDPTRMKLQGSITLVQSFQKKPPPKVAAPAAAKATNQPAKPPGAPAKTNAPPARTTPSRT